MPRRAAWLVMDILATALGVLIITVGVLLALRPQIVDWINDQINLREARKRADRGDDRSLKLYPQLRKTMRLVLPGFLILVGLVVTLQGIF